MKRDFLKNLGIEDKEIIDKIMDENSSDIGKAKAEVDNLKNDITNLNSQISDKDSEISKLKQSVGDIDTLNNKITDLEKSNENYVIEIATLKKNHSIENSLRGAKAKNIKAVMALLDMDKITFGDDGLKGLDEQLETLTKSDSTSFLFGETETKSPSGTEPNNPDNNSSGSNQGTGKSFTEAIASALSGNKN